MDAFEANAEVIGAELPTVFTFHNQCAGDAEGEVGISRRAGFGERGVEPPSGGAGKPRRRAQVSSFHDYPRCPDVTALLGARLLILVTASGVVLIHAAKGSVKELSQRDRDRVAIGSEWADPAPLRSRLGLLYSPRS